MALVTVTGERLWSIQAHDRNIESLAISHDGRRIASAGDQKDPGLKLWDLRTGQLERVIGKLKSGTFDIVFSNDGETIITAGHESVRFWDSDSGQPRRGLAHSTRPISSIALSPDGLLATGGYDRLVSVWDVETGHRLDKITAPRDYVRDVAFTADGQQLISAGDDGAIRLFDMKKARELQQRLDKFSWFRPAGLALSADGTTLASVSALLPGHFADTADGELIIWDVPSGQVRSRLNIEDRDTMDPAISPDGQVVSTCGRGRVRLWDANSDKMAATLYDHAEVAFIDTQFSPDGRWLAAVGKTEATDPHDEAVLLIWDLGTKPPDLAKYALGHPISEYYAWLSFDDTTCHLAVAHSKREYGVVKLFHKSEDGWAASHSFLSFDDVVTASHFIPRSNRWMAATWDGHVMMFEAGRPDPIWRVHPPDTYCMSITSDGRVLATGHNREIRLWDIATADQFAMIETEIWVSSLAFTPDGRTLIWGGGDGSVHFERTEETKH
jgi:WD40 repeat protein